MIGTYFPLIIDFNLSSQVAHTIGIFLYRKCGKFYFNNKDGVKHQFMALFWRP